MSMLFVIYIPVQEPAAYTEHYIISSESMPSQARQVSIEELYSRYLERIRAARSGVETAAPPPTPDQPSPPPPESKLPKDLKTVALKNIAAAKERTSDLQKQVVPHKPSIVSELKISGGSDLQLDGPTQPKSGPGETSETSPAKPTEATAEERDKVAPSRVASSGLVADKISTSVSGSSLAVPVVPVSKGSTHSVRFADGQPASNAPPSNAPPSSAPASIVPIIKVSPSGSTGSLADQKPAVIAPSDVIVSTVGTDKNKPKKPEETKEETLTIRKVLMKIIEAEGIKNCSCRMTDNLIYWKVSFIADSTKCDLVLNSLLTFGFGEITGTSISLFSASFYQNESERRAAVETPETAEVVGETEFAKSVKARLTVAQVLGAVQANSNITFDFMVLLFAASLIAAMGLVENSSVCLVASMLVSPMMGPTIGITFGICIKNSELWKLAARNEALGLGFCVCFGFVFGLGTAAVNRHGAIWGETDTWPTREMYSRGMSRSLLVGLVIGSASGLGVALSVLGGNVGSLVGVAISASILPPAINSGLLWAHSTVWSIWPPSYDYSRLFENRSFEKFIFNWRLNISCPQLLNNKYEFTYSCRAEVEMFVLGLCSILLTIINIICIFVIAIGVLKLKEVAPNVSILTTATANDVFWRSDVPRARKRNLSHTDNDYMTTLFIAEYKAAQTREDKNKLAEKWRSMINSFESDPVYSHTRQSLSHFAQPIPEVFRHLSSSNIDTVAGSLQRRAKSSEAHITAPEPPPEEKPTMMGNLASHFSWFPFFGRGQTPTQTVNKTQSQTTTDRQSQSFTQGRFTVSVVREGKI